MKRLKKISKVIKNPHKLLYFLGSNGMLKWIPDRLYIKSIYRARMGKDLNLKDPQTFNEKLQWLKLHDRNPLYTKLVDKYEVREYISKVIGEEYLIPLIGVWDRFEDIDFSELPSEFVLKTTHDSGGVVICKDKKELDIDTARRTLNKSLKRNYYYPEREWPYKNVKPRIICEELIKTNEGSLPNDYKFHCFNGIPDNVMVCTERDTGNPKFFFFDKQWNLLRYNIAGANAPEQFTLPKPKQMERMFEVAGVLSQNIPFVRVDLYCENDKIYFGELTFFPQSGFDSNLLQTTDILFGEKIVAKHIAKKTRGEYYENFRIFNKYKRK